MNRFRNIAKWLFDMFGGLIVFWIVLLAFGTKPAIAATLLFVLIDGARRFGRRETLPPLYLASTLVGIGFGIIDLLTPTPFMIKWEPLIGNALFAGLFFVGAFDRLPLTAQFALRAGLYIPLDRPEVIRFMRFFGFVWAAYFLARGIAFVWIMHRWPLVEALLIRNAVGWGTLGVMFVLSFAGRRVMGAFQWLGFFRPPTAPISLAAAAAE